MQRSASNIQQVLLSGHEGRCLKILKDIQTIAAASKIAYDAGFLQFENYRTFVAHPVSLESVANRVNGSGGHQKYTYINDFALDVRRIFGNFIRYNCYADPATTKLRKDVMKVLFKFEQCWFELIKSIDQTSPGMYFVQPVAELKWGLTAFEAMVQGTDTDKTYLIDDFMHPIQLYITDPKSLKEYKQIVKHPIAIADIMAKLTEAEYDNIEQMKDDMDRLVNNCSTYWSQPSKVEMGKGIIQKVMKLQQIFLKSLNSSEASLMAKPVPNGPLSLMPRYTPSFSSSSAPAAPAAAVLAPISAPMPTLTLSFAGKGGGKGTGGNNKGKSTATKQAAAPPAVTLVDPAVAAHAAAPVVAFAAAPAKAVLVDTGSRVRPEWELAAEEVWKNIKKHPYVDLSKSSSVIADFWRPIVQVDPSIAADYLATIAVPMDMTLLLNELSLGAIQTPQEFTDLAVTIFQNAIDYNAKHEDSSYALHLVPRCEALRRFTYWHCLEAFPLEDDSIEPKNKSKQPPRGSNVGCPLTLSAQKEQRALRDSILSDWFIHDTGNSPYTECNKLLKDLQRGRNKNENIQISYFQVPVNKQLLNDYSVYVRNPMDLSTIKYRLDGTLPGTAAVAQAIDRTVQRYQKYSEFVADLRRVFTNAIKYNKAHLDTDTTGSSQLVYDAAIMLQERLENLLSMFTVNLAERVDRMRISNAENQLRLAEQRAKKEKEEAEAREFEKKVLEELKATDHVFAADYDLEQKRKLTELQLKEHILQQQRAMLEATNAASAASIEDLGRDIGLDDTSTGGGNMSPLTAGAAGALFGTGMNVNRSLLHGLHIPPIPGFGQAGKVPVRYAHLVELKKGVRDRAWAYWQGASGVITQASINDSKKGLGASSNGHKNSSNSSNKRDSGSIRISNTTSAQAVGGAGGVADSQKVDSMDVDPSAAAATVASGSVENLGGVGNTGGSPKRARTVFSLQPANKMKKQRSMSAGVGPFTVDLSDVE